MTIPSMKIAIARARSAAGNQQAIRYTTPGKKPASATPSRKRWTISDGPSHASAPAAATTPQVIMIRAIQTRAPIRCRTRLLGTSRTT